MFERMESLYRKLYNKYSKLKTEKFSQLEELSRDQEEKFLNYMSAADDLIEHLRNENGRLQAQVNDLRSEMASIRSKQDEQQAKYQKLLMEENQKNKELSEEIQRIQNLQKEPQEFCCTAGTDKNENGQMSTRGGFSVGLDASSGSSVEIRKRSRASGPESERREQKRNLGPETEVTVSHSIPDQIQIMPVKETAHELSKQTMSPGAILEVHLPDCCKRRIDISGGDASVTGTVSCMFQDIIECLIGMKLSTVTEKDGICISAFHQSSGYSFSLLWTDSSSGEAELMYRVLSLGTFERVAPEWMREVLVFSTRMCPIFFERVSRIIKLQY